MRRVVVPSKLPTDQLSIGLSRPQSTTLRDHAQRHFFSQTSESLTSVVLSLRRARQWRMAELVLGLRAIAQSSAFGQLSGLFNHNG